MSDKDTTISAARFWGYLIKPDKTPTPILEQLLLGVANYINRHVAPWDIHCLTPTKLATFYRLVGGDYDPLFLDTSRASLSFIYQSLGCFHTLQPEKDPYSPPTLPTLTPQGFVRWQTVQLLLEPDEHVPFLQEAVKRFELTNPVDGEPFPSVLPREALPVKPDLQMTEWHDTVAEKLMLEAQASQMRKMPHKPQMALSDADPTESSRPSSGDSTIETSSMVGAAGYSSHPHTYLNSRSHPPTTPFAHTQPAARGIPSQRKWAPSSAYDAPWSPLRRRSSLPSDNRSRYHRPSVWPHGHPTSTNHPYNFAPSSQNQRNRPQPHTRTPSTLSGSSFTSDSSCTTSSASLSPILQSAQVHQTGGAGAAAAAVAAQGGDIRRSQSLGYFHPPPGRGNRPHIHQHTHIQSPPPRPRPSSGVGPPPNPSGGGWDMSAANGTRNGNATSNDKGRNVRWPDQAAPRGGDGVTRVKRSDTVRAPDSSGTRSARSVDGRRSERERERERRGQSVGLSGRAYA